MVAIVLNGAARDLQQAFDYHEAQQSGLGDELLEEFRRSVDRILQYPDAWPRLDGTYRRCRFHRFPYGIVYRTDTVCGDIVIVAIMHLSRHPDWWKRRSG
jgi:plasmid stabilization system protein ParE